MKPKKKRSYHHGNLNEALVVAAMRLIEERGGAEFTLRELARELGVTHAATYHHFKDKDDLLATVAARGFAELTERVRAARDSDVCTDPEHCLSVMAEAYVRFAVEYPARFRVMYSRKFTGASDQEDAAHATGPLRDDLLQIVLHGQRDGVFTDGDPEELVSLMWSLVHGLAVLMSTNALEAPDVDGHVRRVARHALVGILM